MTPDLSYSQTISDKYFRNDEERHESGLSNDEQNSQLRTHLTTDLMRSTIWTLSKISYSFMKFKPFGIQKDQRDGEQNDAKQSILKSQLFSGGIEKRFISEFSSIKTLKLVELLTTVTGDTEKNEYLEEVEFTHEDSILQAITQKGKMKIVDLLIDVLDWSLKQANPLACIKGEKGILLARCAFAATLKLNKEEE